jgi:hypothetical protein
MNGQGGAWNNGGLETYGTALYLLIKCQLSSSSQESARILPVCVSPATSCGGPVLLDRTDLTENGRLVLLTMI